MKNCKSLVEGSLSHDHGLSLISGGAESNFMGCVERMQVCLRQ
jgi:hypothetical protein